jgi:hypothetical protein
MIARREYSKPMVPTSVGGRRGEMCEIDRGAMMRALCDEHALHVYAQMVAATVRVCRIRSGGSMSIHYVNCVDMDWRVPA